MKQPWQIDPMHQRTITAGDICATRNAAFMASSKRAWSFSKLRVRRGLSQDICYALGVE